MAMWVTIMSLRRLHEILFNLHSSDTREFWNRHHFDELVSSSWFLWSVRSAIWGCRCRTTIGAKLDFLNSSLSFLSNDHLTAICLLGDSMQPTRSLCVVSSALVTPLRSFGFRQRLRERQMVISLHEFSAGQCLHSP